MLTQNTSTNMAAETTNSTQANLSISTSTKLTSESVSGPTPSEQPDFSSIYTSTASTGNTTSGISETSASVSSWSHPKPSIDLQLIIPLCVATGIVSCIIIGLCCFMKRNNLMPSFNCGKRRSMNVRRRYPKSQPSQEAPHATVLTLHKRHSISAPDLLCATSSYSYPGFITTKQRLIQIRPPAEKVPNNSEHSTDGSLVDIRLTQNKTFTQKGQDAYMLGQELNMVTSKPHPIINISDPHIYQSVAHVAYNKKSDGGQFASIGKRRSSQARVGQVQLTQLWDQN